MSKPLPPSPTAADQPAADALQARFMTSIETDLPVNPDPAAEDAFNKRPEVEERQGLSHRDAVPSKPRSSGGAEGSR